MDYDSFCKQVLIPALTGAAISTLCHLIIDEFKKIRDSYRLIKLLRELEDALDKGIEEAKVMELNQTLEALEKEIKASQNEKLLQLHEALVKNIKASPNFELKE